MAPDKLLKMHICALIVYMVKNLFKIYLFCSNKASRAEKINDLAMLFLAGFWPSESTVWTKFGPKKDPSMKFEC